MSFRSFCRVLDLPRRRAQRKCPLLARGVQRFKNIWNLHGVGAGNGRLWTLAGTCGGKKSLGGRRNPRRQRLRQVRDRPGRALHARTLTGLVEGCLHLSSCFYLCRHPEPPGKCCSSEQTCVGGALEEQSSRTRGVKRSDANRGESGTKTQGGGQDPEDVEQERERWP